MKRRQFITIATGTIVIAGVTYYLLSDKQNVVRTDSDQSGTTKTALQPAEREILFLASLAPSGHNTQPWFIKYIAPYHWIIGNDTTRWLPGVDPMQRETILSIGAFMQNLEYAATHFGYTCNFKPLALTNQDEDIMEVQLIKVSNSSNYSIGKIKQRRTVRSNYLSEPISKEDLNYLIYGESNFIYSIPNTTKEHHWLNEQTIEANRIQSYRDAAQTELANWIRFSSKDAANNCDGLTTAGMEIEGMPAWILRNFYNKSTVMKKSFREQSIDKVVKQVGQSAGWLLITSKDNTVATLLETGQRMQRLFLKVKDKGIAIHPMTQILEETSTAAQLQDSMAISNPVQFILRTGYLKKYPNPVSLRRSVDRFIRT